MALCECGQGVRTSYGGCDRCKELDRKFHQLAADHHVPAKRKPNLHGGPNILNLANGQRWKFARSTYRKWLDLEDDQKGDELAGALDGFADAEPTD
jgi:hypothetical protein